jgi:predicted nucleic acid-binding protein
MTSTITDAFVVDTHPLVWYLMDDTQRLSSAANGIFKDAEEGLVDIIIPAIVVAEAIYVGEKYDLPVSFERLAELIRAEPKFIVLPLDLPVLEAMARIGARMEMHDRVIAATASLYGAAVLTKDRAFEGVVQTVW